MEFTPEQLQTELESNGGGSGTPVVVAPALPVTTAHYVQCGFCECKLTPVGNVYEISDKARDYRDDKEAHRKEIARLNEEISRLSAEITKRENTLREISVASQKRKFL